MVDTRPKPIVQTLSEYTANKIQDAFDIVMQTGTCSKYNSRRGITINYDKRLKMKNGIMDPKISVQGVVHGPDCPVTTINRGNSQRPTSTTLTVTRTNIPAASGILKGGIITPIVTRFIPKNSPLSSRNFNSLNFHVLCRDRFSRTQQIGWHLDAHNLGLGTPVYQIIYYVDTPKTINGQDASVQNRGSLAFLLTHGSPDPGNRRATSVSNIPVISGFLTPTRGIGIGFDPYSSWHKVINPNSTVDVSRKIIIINVYDPAVPYTRGMQFGNGTLGNNIERRMNAYANSVQKAYNALNNRGKKTFLNRISGKPFVQNVGDINNDNAVEIIVVLSANEVQTRKLRNAKKNGRFFNLTQNNNS